jgi:hypothetical protein
MTTYTLLTSDQRKVVASLGRRCFGPANVLAGMNFFFPRKDDRVRKNAAKLLPKGTVLARVGLDWKAAQALFGHWKTWKSRMVINATVSENAAPKVNAGLRSNVLFLTARGWK